MNVSLYAGDVLAYDSRLPVESGYNVLSIRIEESVNKGGTATIVLPPRHPLYNGFPAFRTPVEIYRNGKLRWRGRPLPPSGDFYNRRTIVCEGELCFLQDVVHRPYLYQADPAAIFAQVIAVYNTAVEPWKRFAVGTVTVTDPNDYIRLEGQNPAKVYGVVLKLVERCGGYLFFDSAPDGARRINWYASLPYSCNQPVRFGENLIDYSSQSDVTNFATRIVPYGAIGEDGTRLALDIDGKDYVENAEAVALRGVIEASVIYDDITQPQNLLARAMQDLESMALIPDVIQLSAIDLSRQDLQLDTFMVGQQILAESEPHGLSGTYGLIALTEDLVNPTVGGVTLCRETASLSGSDGRTLTGALAVGDRNNSAALEKADQEIRADYQKNIAVTEEKLTSIIEQSASDIRMEVSDVRSSVQQTQTNLAAVEIEADTLSAQVAQQVSELGLVRENLTQIQQSAGSLSVKVQSILDNGVERVTTKEKHYTLDDDGLKISQPGKEIENRLDETGMYVTRSGTAMLQANNNGVITTDLTVRNYLKIAHARFEAYGAGATACFWMQFASGQNILLDSGRTITNNDYNTATYTPSSPLVEGETYTVSLCVTPAPGVTLYSVFLSSGGMRNANLYVQGPSRQVIRATFVAHYSSGMTPTDSARYAQIRLHRFPNDGTVTDDSIVHWCKVEIGDTPTDWSPAPED